MALTIPATFEPISIETFSYDRPIRHGASAAKRGEADLLLNQNYLQAYMWPAWVSTHYRAEDPGGGCYIVGAATVYGNARSVWHRRFYRDLADWHVAALVENTSGSHAGTVKFELESNGANVEVNVPASSSQWALVSDRLTINQGAAGQRDAIEMYVKNGTTGAIRVHWAGVRPSPLSSLVAGVSTEGVLPFDDTFDCGINRPLSTQVRQRAFDNLDALRKTRSDTIVGWSEDGTRASSTAFETTSATQQLVAVIPFKTTHGQVAIEWALYGYLSAGAGSVKLETLKTADSQTITLTTGWSSPYSGSLYEDSDAGQATLSTVPNADDLLFVYVTADGVNTARLMGLTAWLKDIV